MKRRLLPLLLVCLSGPVIAQEASPPTSLSQECTRRLADEPDYAQPADMTKKALAAIEACQRAAEASPNDAAVQRQFAAALLADGRLEPAFAVLRPLAAKGDTEALFTIYTIHAFRERGSDRNVVGRVAAEAALRKAAELGHPQATYTLAQVLFFGGVSKRDPAAALEWAEKAVPLAPAGAALHAKILLGEILTRPERSTEQRERGFALLETVATDPDGKIALARALRLDGAKRDLARARVLLEDAWRADNGSAAALLATMLIGGEGGAKDVPRALALLRDDKARYSSEARGTLGQLHVEGRVVRREPLTAAPLLEYAAYLDVDRRIRLAEMLTVHTSAKLNNPKGFLFTMMEAAAVGEPGAMAALIELAFSRHDQLRDESLGHALVEKAADTDDRAMVRLLERRAGGVNPDAGQVRGGLERLMAKNVGPAFTLHGKLLRRGGVFPQDDVAATKSLQRAAELGDIDGMLLLAKAYNDGLGTPKNPREQLRWLREAAKRDSVEARRALLWEARFDSTKQMTLRDIATEQVALYNDRLGSISTQDFMGFFIQSRMSDFQPKRIAEALMEGFRVAPAGLAEDRMVPLMRQIPQNLRAEIETNLKAAGHYQGDTQGYFGPEARAALGAWVDAGLGKDPAQPSGSKPAAQTVALATEPANKPGAAVAGDVPKITDEQFKTYWARILAAFKGAKNQKDAREAFRMLIVMARGGNTHARYQLVKAYDDQALVREMVTPTEITTWGFDVLISKLDGMDKAKIEFVFNTSRIDRSRQMQRWTDGFMIAVRDDPRLSQEGTLTQLLQDMVFVGGACDAIAGRIRTLKLANVSDNDGCGPVARDALLDLVKTQGPTGTESKARMAAAKQLLAEVSGEQAAVEAPAVEQKQKKRR